MKHFILALTVALTLGACANNTSGIMASSTGESRVDNSSLGRSLSIEQLLVRSEDGFLQGTGTLVSHKSSDQALQYKFSWFDLNGMSIDDEGMSWKAVNLHGYQQLQVSSVAPNPSAIRFELQVRKVH